MPDLVCTKAETFMGRNFKKGMCFHTGNWYAGKLFERYPDSFRYARSDEKPGPLPPISDDESPESEE